MKGGVTPGALEAALEEAYASGDSSAMPRWRSPRLTVSPCGRPASR